MSTINSSQKPSASLAHTHPEWLALIKSPRVGEGHLGASAYGRIVDADVTEIFEIILPHLIECRECREDLEQAMHRADAPAYHPGYALLRDATEGAGWASAGQTAAQAACRELTEQGIGYVYGSEGAVYRRLSDGQEELLSRPEPLGS